MEQNFNIFLVVEDNFTQKLLMEYLSKYEELISLSKTDELLGNICHLSKNEKSIVIIDVDEDTNNTLSLIKKITQSEKNVQLIALASNCSAELLMLAMRAGVCDVVAKPILRETFCDVFDKVKATLQTEISKSKCKIISSFSNKGGIGKTAISVNLGVEIANLTKKNVAIVDLNLQLGDVTTFLDLEPKFDISYLMENFDRINSEFLLSSMQQYKDTSLYILAEPSFVEQANDISKEQILKLLDKMKETFDYIIVDTGSNFDDKTLGALDASDIILLCTIVNLPAIRSCQRCLDLFDRLGYNSEKVKIILNRYMENDEIKTYDVERVLNKKVWWKIPNNYITMISSINKGLPIREINADSNIAQNFQEFASKLADGIEYLNIEKQKLNKEEKIVN